MFDNLLGEDLSEGPAETDRLHDTPPGSVEKAPFSKAFLVVLELFSTCGTAKA